jgi:hypothetical protein
MVNAGAPGVESGGTALGPVETCHVVPSAEDQEPEANPFVAASLAVAELTVAAPQIMIEPHPSDNKWNVLAVGMPIWAGFDDAESLHASASHNQVSVTMEATRAGVLFDWGDGETSFCTTGGRRPGGIHPLKESPHCGHKYLKAGEYTITATAKWDVAWEALGSTGTIGLSASSSIDVPVREFAAVVVG